MVLMIQRALTGHFILVQIDFKLTKELLLPPNQDLFLFIFIWAVSTSKDNRLSQMFGSNQYHFLLCG